MAVESPATSRFTPLEEDLQRLAQLRLMDDDFFSEALDNKPEAVGYIVNTILERDDLKIQSARTQVEYKSATKRSLKLDIRAEDAEGRVIDIEIQRADRGTGVRRARFHSSMIDRSLLEKGDDFEELSDSYVIFITENDKFDRGLPLYHIERKVTELGDTLFGDGAHILYVNGAFRDISHPVGRLMHDFNCTNAADMFSELLAAEVRYLKEDERGRTSMCKLLEEMRDEAAEKATYAKAIETARSMLADGFLTYEKIAQYSGLSLDEIKELAGQRSA